MAILNFSQVIETHPEDLTAEFFTAMHSGTNSMVCLLIGRV
jgi:hypothetical protein